VSFSCMLLGGVLGDGAAFFFSVQCKSVIGCWRKVMFLMRYLMYRLGGGGGGILLTAWVLFSIPAPTVDVHFVHRWR